MLLKIIHNDPESIKKIERFVRIAVNELGTQVRQITVEFTDYDMEDNPNCKSGERVLGGVRGIGGYNLDEGMFLIRLDSSVHAGIQALTLCHELVHVKQFASGDLKFVTMDYRHPSDRTKDYMVDGMSWCDEFYPLTTPYKERPWEVEAEKGERPLFDKVNTIIASNEVTDDVAPSTA